MKKLCFCAAALLVLAGCENMGNLYPLDPLAAGSDGIATHLSWSGTGSGTIDIVLPGGENMTGQFGPAYSNANFGDVFKAVYGQYSTLPVAANNGTPTIANLTGNKGTTMKCEFYNDDNTDHGFGGCKASNGALYRLKY